MNGTSAYGAAKNYTDEHGGGGGGNVNSVNGKKGNVLLNASDIKDKNGKTVEDRLSDVVDNLITNDPSKPISARQGKTLQDNKADKSEAVQFTLIPLTEPKTREEIRNLYASSAYKFRMMTTCFTNDDSPTGSSASVFVVNVYGAGKRIILKATLTNISTGVSMGDEWTCLYKGTGSPDQWEPWIKTIDISKGLSPRLYNHIIVLQGGKPEIKVGLQIIDAKQTDLTINEILLFIKNSMTTNDADAIGNNKTYAAWGTVNEDGGKYPISGIYYSFDRNITCVVFNYTKFLDDEHTKITNEPTICPFAANLATIITQSTIELK